jgi:hypothetical protein
MWDKIAASLFQKCVGCGIENARPPKINTNASKNIRMKEF